MVILTKTFIVDVLSSYTFYRYYVTRSEHFEQLVILHGIWCTFYNINTLLTIYAGSRLKRKVAIIEIECFFLIILATSSNFELLLQSNIPSLVIQGEEMAIISHRVSNKCNNKDIDSAVTIDYS